MIKLWLFRRLKRLAAGRWLWAETYLTEKVYQAIFERYGPQADRGW